MPQCQFLFSAVFVFQKSCTGNILGIAWEKLLVPLNHVTKTVSEGDLRGAARWPDPIQARPDPGPRLGGVWAHQGARLRLFAYLFSYSRKPLGDEKYSMKSSVAAVINEPVSGRFWSSSR